MSVEQIARDFVTNMTNPEKLKGLATADAVASGGVLPHPMPLMESMGVVGALSTAMPDFKFDIERVTVNGNEATVEVKWGGTNSGPLDLRLPGMPAALPTGKRVSVRDAFVITVHDDKVSHVQVDSPAGGGIPGALAQLGVMAPGM